MPIPWDTVRQMVDRAAVLAVLAVLTIHSSFAVTHQEGGKETYADHRDDRKQWSGVASSADGNRLAAVIGGYHGAQGHIYVSADAGESWTAANSEVRAWRAIASSADGFRLVAVEDSSNGQRGGYIHTSDDAGLSWVTRDTSGSRIWLSVSSSHDGNLLAAVVGADVCETRHAFTLTLTPTQNACAHTHIHAHARACTHTQAHTHTHTHTHTCVNKTRGRLQVGGYTGESGNIHTSSDGGATWQPRMTDAVHSWRDIAASADGTHLLACAANCYLYSSADAGTTWTVHEDAGARDWTGVATSADGVTLVAVAGETGEAGANADGGRVYLSRDAGASWMAAASARAWNGISCSADGGLLLAMVVGRDYLYTSADAGGSWSRAATPNTWQAIASSADGQRLVAVVRYGHIFTSADGGSTWTQRVSGPRSRPPIPPPSPLHQVA